MKKIIQLITGFFLLTLFSCASWNYAGYKFGAGIDTVGPVTNHTESGEKDYATNLDVIFGKSKDRLHYGLETGIDIRDYRSPDKEKDDQAIMVWDNTLFATYDFVKKEKWQLYGGVGAGIGLPLSHEEGYPLVRDSGYYGNLDYRVGARIQLKDGEMVLIEYKMGHISGKGSDPGSNVDILLIGVIFPFSSF